MKRKLDYHRSVNIFSIVFIITVALFLYAIMPQTAVTRVEGAVKSTSVSDDTYSDSQWNIFNPGSYSDYSLGYSRTMESQARVDMNVANAWNTIEKDGTAKREVIVAVIDTGVDYKNRDLVGRIWTNHGEIKGDHKDNDNNGYIDDYYGWDFYNDDSSVCHYSKNNRTASSRDVDNHGTHVAGIIAAIANNKLGIAGVASDINVKIMILKINGGKNEEGKMSDAVEAIKYAQMMGADICNLSWGTEEYSEDLYQTMKNSDMLFVAAAGSDGTNNDKHPLYPANFNLSNLITVTSVDAYGRIPFFGNYGPNSVDIAAPGEVICSTIVGGYGTMSGSSMAAPQVTGVAAMLYAFHEHLYAYNVKDMILSHLKAYPALEGKIRYPGIPDANACVSDNALLVQDENKPEISVKTEFNKNMITVPVDTQDYGGSKLRIVKWIYGKKKVSDFRHGVNGTLVTDGKVDLAVAGTYTFYAADYAGNETVLVYDVKDDKTTPKISASYTVSDDYRTRTVSVVASDSESGIKRVKYMPGQKTATDFLPADAGKKITLRNGKGSFTVKSDGAYTLFIVDNRGNMTVRLIKVRTIKSIGLSFKVPVVTLTQGNTYYLKMSISPINSTDKITYTSQNNSIAKVSSIGRVSAISEGTAYITAKTTNGDMAICKVVVFSDA